MNAMIKRRVIAVIFLLGFFSYAQQSTDTTTVKEGWISEGAFTLLFNQSAFSNWQAGGENSIGGNAGLNYSLNYLKGNWNWDNTLAISYGLTKTEGAGLRKTDDRFELNSLAGKKTSLYWRYSFFTEFRIQFTPGYHYENDPGANFATSGPFRPAYLSFGPGMAWKKSKNLKCNLAPATSKLTLLGGEIFTYDDDTGLFVSSNERTTFGVEPGKSLRYELGFYASGYVKFKLMENVTVENILNLYSNYLEDPQNIDINYQLNIAMKINDYLSANIAFQAMYDDNAFAGFQIREVSGLGINYNF